MNKLKVSGMLMLVLLCVSSIVRAQLDSVKRARNRQIWSIHEKLTQVVKDQEKEWQYISVMDNSLNEGVVPFSHGYTGIISRKGENGKTERIWIRTYNAKSSGTAASWLNRFVESEKSKQQGEAQVSKYQGGDESYLLRYSKTFARLLIRKEDLIVEVEGERVSLSDIERFAKYMIMQLDNDQPARSHSLRLLSGQLHTLAALRWIIG